MGTFTSRTGYIVAMAAVLWSIFTGAFTPGRNEAADVTPTQAVTVAAVSGDAVVAHEVAVISASRICAPVTVWLRQHPHQFPTEMVLKRDGTYQVSVAAWTYPAPAGQWTLALCSR